MSEEFGFRILEDDWGSDMMSFSEFRPLVRAQGGDGVFYPNSFTKKLLPSLRVGYIVGCETTTRLLLESKRVSCLGLPAIIEAMLFEFLDRGYYDAHIKKVRIEMDRRYHLCLEGLRSSMPDEVKWTTLNGEPCLWLEIPHRVPLEQLQARMAKQNVMCSLYNHCFLGRPHLNGFRIGYDLPKPEALARAIDILGEELRGML